MDKINELKLFLAFNKDFYKILNDLSKNEKGKKIGSSKNLIIVDDRFSEYVYSKILAGKLISEISWTNKQTTNYKELLQIRKPKKKSMFFGGQETDPDPDPESAPGPAPGPASEQESGQDPASDQSQVPGQDPASEQEPKPDPGPASEPASEPVSEPEPEPKQASEQKSDNFTSKFKEYTKNLIEKLNGYIEKKNGMTEIDNCVSTTFEDLCTNLNNLALLSEFNNSLYVELNKSLKVEMKHGKKLENKFHDLDLMVNKRLNEVLYTKMIHGKLDDEDWPSQKQVETFIKGINRKGAWTQGMMSFGSKKSNNESKSSMFSWGKKKEVNTSEEQVNNIEEVGISAEDGNQEKIQKNGGKKNIRKNNVIKKTKIKKIYKKNLKI